MRLSIKEHRTPIAVTAVGLLVATGLATAPLIMADSETDELAKQNATDIKKLSTLVDGSSDDTQQQLLSFTNSTAGQLSNLENQILTLNKAAKRLHQRQISIQSPSGTVQSSIKQLSQNTDARLLILEKAVSQLHRKQRAITAASSSASATNEESEERPDDLRLVNLEKGIKNLNLKISRSTDTAAKSTTKTPNYDDRIDELERMIQRLSQQQRINGSSSDMRLEATVRKDIETDVRFNAMERALARLGERINQIEDTNPTSRRDPLADQLYEIRDTVDLLLNEISSRSR